MALPKETSNDILATQKKPQDRYGPVLVVGGCGFVGFHIVRHLLQDPAWGPVFVVVNQIKTYRKIHQTKDYIHAASPLPTDLTVTSHLFHDINVTGTKNLLACARETPSVKAFIYTSSVMVISGTPHIQVDETQPIWQPHSRAEPYFVTKAMADSMILKANSPQLRTASLRLALVYGERDIQFIPRVIDAYYKGRTGIQLGDNTNLLDQVYVGNAATAHLLAAKALLRPGSVREQVDGEAFNISDGAPVPYWNLMRTIWNAAGDTTKVENVTIIPAWAALAIAGMVELAFWVLTLGLKRAVVFNREVVRFCLHTHTYNIDKAKKHLGYNPTVDLEGTIQRAVAWEVRRREGMGLANKK